LGRAALRVERAPATGAELVAAFATGERLTRLSSPAIHFTSTFAKHWKRLVRQVGNLPRKDKRNPPSGE
jgi:hypothetical protein